jgi:hypothetical protein
MGSVPTAPWGTVGLILGFAACLFLGMVRGVSPERLAVRALVAAAVTAAVLDVFHKVLSQLAQTPPGDMSRKPVAGPDPRDNGRQAEPEVDRKQRAGLP